MNDANPPKPNGHGDPSGLRTLIRVIVLSLLVAGAVWLGVKTWQAASHQAIVQPLAEAGWRVGYEYQILGYGLGNVVYVGPAFDGPASSGSGYDLGDEDLEQLKRLTRLRHINLDNTRVTGPGLIHLRDLADLRELSLDGANVTDAGLEQIKEFTNLRFLNFSHMPVTDAGLKHLKSLTNLKVLVICCLYKDGKKISEADIKKLQVALPNCQVIGP